VWTVTYSARENVTNAYIESSMRDIAGVKLVWKLKGYFAVPTVFPRIIGLYSNLKLSLIGLNVYLVL